MILPGHITENTDISLLPGQGFPGPQCRFPRGNYGNDIGIIIILIVPILGALLILLQNCPYYWFTWVPPLEWHRLLLLLWSECCCWLSHQMWRLVLWVFYCFNHQLGTQFRFLALFHHIIWWFHHVCIWKRNIFERISFCIFQLTDRNRGWMWFWTVSTSFSQLLLFRFYLWHQFIFLFVIVSDNFLQVPTHRFLNLSQFIIDFTHAGHFSFATPAGVIFVI